MSENATPQPPSDSQPVRTTGPRAEDESRDEVPPAIPAGAPGPVDMPRVATGRPVPMPTVRPARPSVGMPEVRPRGTGPGPQTHEAVAWAREHRLSATDEQIRDWIDLAVFAVLEAAPTALRHFRTDVAVQDKRSHGVFDPVTAADREVEASIRDFLRRHLPAHRVIGEEAPDSPGDARFTWVIDPIDGTRAFISGLPLWGTLVGLVVDGEPVGGVMHQPFTGETFVADPVRGTVLVHRGTMSKLHTRAVPGGLEDAILYSTHPSQFDVVGAGAAFEAVTDRVRLQRWGGDCYSFAMLAAGCIDLVIEGDLKSYDIAPLIPIVEQAGGLVTDLAGNPPTQGADLVIASGDPRLHAEVLAILRAELAPQP